MFKKLYEAFLYIWYDGRSKMFYLGKHLGIPEDSYTHSSSIWESFKKDNIPERVHRRILAYGTHEEMCIIEHECLKNRKSKGKHCWDRYYNKGVGGLNGIAISGKNHWNFGKKMSKKTKDAMRASNLGKPRSEETKKKISIAHIGKTISEEHKAKLRIVRAKQLVDEEYLEKYKKGIKKAGLLRRGENNHFFGKTHSEETKKKIAIAKKEFYENNPNIASTWSNHGEEHHCYIHGKSVNARKDPDVMKKYKADYYLQNKKIMDRKTREYRLSKRYPILDTCSGAIL